MTSNYANLFFICTILSNFMTVLDFKNDINVRKKWLEIIF